MVKQSNRETDGGKYCDLTDEFLLPRTENLLIDLLLIIASFAPTFFHLRSQGPLLKGPAKADAHRFSPAAQQFFHFRFLCPRGFQLPKFNCDKMYSDYQMWIKTHFQTCFQLMDKEHLLMSSIFPHKHRCVFNRRFQLCKSGIVFCAVLTLLLMLPLLMKHRPPL